MTTDEAFIELCPAETGYNLRHHMNDGYHVTGEECPCQPERIEHAAPKGETK